MLLLINPNIAQIVINIQSNINNPLKTNHNPFIIPPSDTPIMVNIKTTANPVITTFKIIVIPFQSIAIMPVVASVDSTDNGKVCS